MATWKETEKQRDDDPYHAWAYHKALSERRGKKSKTLCAVVIELKAHNGATDGLVKALLALLTILLSKRELATILDALKRPDLMGAVPARGVLSGEGAGRDALDQVTCTEYERAHLVASLKAYVSNTDAPRALEEKDLYAQLFVLYAPEAVLFPKRLKPALWDNKLFSIRFVGQAVRSTDTRENFDTSGADRDTSKARFLTIIDDSMAFLNEAFVLADGSTCFDHIWFQDRERPEAGECIGGARLTRDDINAYLAELRKADGPSERTLYESLLEGCKQGGGALQFRLIDHASTQHQPLAFAESHGTHVASTALKKFRSEGGDMAKLGVSAITLPTDVTQDTSGAALGSYLIAALRQAMLWNDQHHDGVGMQDKPLVISCSYGFLAGAKDGFDGLSSVISDMLYSRNALGRPTAFVVPMGNQYNTRSVADATLKPGESLKFDLVLAPDDQTANFLELFAKGAGAKLHLRVSAPVEHDPLDIPFEVMPANGSSTPSPDLRQTLYSDDETLIGEWAEWEPGSPWPRRCDEQSRWDLRGALCLGPTASLEQPEGVVPAGRWVVEISNTSSVEVEIVAMVQRDDAPGTYPRRARQSFLDHPDAHEYGDNSTDYASANWDQFKEAECPLTHSRTASVLASIDSPYLFAVGAGQGALDRSGRTPVEASRYSGAGPRGDDIDGPEYTEMSDRTEMLPGIFGAGTYSGQEVSMDGSSVAAPQAAAHLVATFDSFKSFAEKKHDLLTATNPPFAARRSSKFGFVRSK
ncbi:MAG: hypothetical protein AAF230_04440 [Pseudomonadota bacterium]